MSAPSIASCLTCGRVDLKKAIRLDTTPVCWVCLKCHPDPLPDLDPEQLKIVLLLDRLQNLSDDQLVVLRRLSDGPLPHRRLIAYETAVLKLRKVGLVSSTGGSNNRVHQLTETGVMLKNLLNV